MPQPEARSGDLILNEGQYAFVQDLTKGLTNVYVGPYKTSLAGTDQPVKPDANKRFVPCSLAEAIVDFPMAGEGSYIVLDNPAMEPSKAHPTTGSSQAIPLNWGRTINAPGPVRLPLWPGQVARVIEGHKLRTDQYLVASVTNGDEATKNWPQAVLQASQPPTDKDKKSSVAGTEGALGGAQAGAGGPPPTPPLASPPTSSAAVAKFVTGQRIVIRGTEISFFIPPTGVEVQVEQGKYVRGAVSLESLQYCVLRSEAGKKRYVHGPAVVFPEPDEEFVVRDSERVFRAFVLNREMGIHVSVVEPYNDDVTKPVDDPAKADHKKGDELFITGEQQSIYYPRPEHVIIKYREDQQVHYAVVIPAGEGRYVLNKETGAVQLVKGPKMLLCDPRNEVLVLRPLSESEVSLWFPTSREAAAVNADLREMSSRSDRYVTAESYGGARGGDDGGRFVGTEVARRGGFTQPKSITLNTKYQGAVGVNVWPGYAVQVVGKTGDRKTVVGPANLLLEYDQTLAVMELTTGTPKDDHREKLRTVYLRVTGNRVSDQVQVETSDMVGVTVSVSYRVNFQGDDARWFYIEDYVGFLVDHLRSVIRNAVKRSGIEEFNRNAVDILRNAVLGAPGEGAKRTGKPFDENGMHVYDLEVLDVKIGDAKIDALLRGAELQAVQDALDLERGRRKFKITEEAEDLKRKTSAEATLTSLELMSNSISEAQKRLEVDAATQKVEFERERARLEAQKGNQAALDALNESQLAREKAVAEQAQSIAKAKQALEIARIEKASAGDVERFKAMQPELVKALQSLGDKDLMARLATSLKTVPMGLDEGMGDVMGRLFKGTVLESALASASGKNGSVSTPAGVRS